MSERDYDKMKQWADVLAATLKKVCVLYVPLVGTKAEKLADEYLAKDEDE